MKPRTSDTVRPAKDTEHDVEGEQVPLTLKDLMKHARHDGKGMVRRALCTRRMLFKYLCTVVYLLQCGLRLQAWCLRECEPSLLQFLKHMRALLLKRYQYFKRDLKGFLFLVFIPLAVMLAIVALLHVCRVHCLSVI